MADVTNQAPNMRGGHPMTAALLLAALLAGAFVCPTVSAASARAGDILIDGTVQGRQEGVKPYIEVRSPDGAVRGKVVFPTAGVLDLFGTTATRKWAFTQYQDTAGEARIFVSSISGDTYKVETSLKMPKLSGVLSICGGSVNALDTAVATSDPAVTELYMTLDCLNSCSGSKSSPNYVIVMKYSSKTKKLTGPFKRFPTASSKCSSLLVNVATPPAIIDGAPYVVGVRTQTQLFKLTTAGPKALGPKLNLPELPDGFPLSRCRDIHVAGAASFYAVCETVKRGSKLPQFALYQFRKDVNPRIVGKLPPRTSIFINDVGAGLLATSPSFKTLYVIALTQSASGSTFQYNILSLDRTKIDSAFRRRWRVSNSVAGSVELKLVP